MKTITAAQKVIMEKGRYAQLFRRLLVRCDLTLDSVDILDSHSLHKDARSWNVMFRGPKKDVELVLKAAFSKSKPYNAVRMNHGPVWWYGEFKPTARGYAHAKKLLKEAR